MAKQYDDLAGLFGEKSYDGLDDLFGDYRKLQENNPHASTDDLVHLYDDNLAQQKRRQAPITREQDFSTRVSNYVDGGTSLGAAEAASRFDMSLEAKMNRGLQTPLTSYRNDLTTLNRYEQEQAERDEREKYLALAEADGDWSAKSFLEDAAMGGGAFLRTLGAANKLAGYVSPFSYVGNQVRDALGVPSDDELDAELKAGMDRISARQSDVRKFQQQQIADADGYVEKLSALTGHPRELVGTLIQSLPTTAALMVLGGTSIPVNVAVNTFGESAGTFLQARDEALAAGLNNTAADLLGLKAAGAAIPGNLIGAALGAKFETSVMKGRTPGLLPAIGLEAADEGVQNASSKFGTNYAASHYNPEVGLTDGIGGAFAEGNLVGGAMGGGLHSVVRTADFVSRKLSLGEEVSLLKGTNPSPEVRRGEKGVTDQDIDFGGVADEVAEFRERQSQPSYATQDIANASHVTPPQVEINPSVIAAGEQLLANGSQGVVSDQQIQVQENENGEVQYPEQSVVTESGEVVPSTGEQSVGEPGSQAVDEQVVRSDGQESVAESVDEQVRALSGFVSAFGKSQISEQLTSKLPRFVTSAGKLNASHSKFLGKLFAQPTPDAVQDFINSKERATPWQGAVAQFYAENFDEIREVVAPLIDETVPVGKAAIAEKLTPELKSAIYKVMGWDEDGYQVNAPVSAAAAAREAGVKPEALRKQLNRLGLTKAKIGRIFAGAADVKSVGISELLPDNNERSEKDGPDGADERNFSVVERPDSYTVSERPVAGMTAEEQAIARKNVRDTKVAEDFIAQGVAPELSEIQKRIDDVSQPALSKAHADIVERETESDRITREKREAEAAANHALREKAVKSYLNMREGKEAANTFNEFAEDDGLRFEDISIGKQLDWFEQYTDLLERTEGNPSNEQLEGLYNEFKRAEAHDTGENVGAQASVGYTERGVESSDAGNSASEQGVQGTDGGKQPTVIVKRKRGKSAAEDVNRDLKAKFSKGEGASGQTRERLQEELKSVFKSPYFLDRAVAIVNSDADLPAEMVDAVRSQGSRVQGMYDPTTRKVWLIANNIPEGDELGVILHELGVHKGMRNLLGKERYAALLKQVKQWAESGKGVEGEIARKAQQRVKVAEDEHVEDELLAYFVEEAVNAGIDPTAIKPTTKLGQWFQTLLDSIKKAIHALGIKPDSLTAQDVVDLAYGAANLEISEVAADPAQQKFSKTEAPDVNSEGVYGKDYANGEKILATRLARLGVPGIKLDGGRGIGAVLEQQPQAGQGERGGADASLNRQGATVQEEQEKLIALAKEHGFFFESGSKFIEVVTSNENRGGTEHDAYFVGEPNNRVVIRSTAKSGFGLTSHDSPAEYLRRIDEYNRTFPLLQIRVVGVSQGGNSVPVIWTAQSFVPGKMFKNHVELFAALKAKGWEKISGGPFRFRHTESGAVIDDAHFRNVLHVGDKLYPIDVIIKELPKENAQPIKFSKRGASDEITDTVDPKGVDLVNRTMIGVLKDNIGNAAHKLALRASTVSQIVDAYKDRLPALRTYKRVNEDMTSMRTDIERDVLNVAVQWMSLGKEIQRLNKLTKDATMSGIHPDKPFEEQDLPTSAFYAWNNLNMRWSALSDKAKAVYLDGQRVLADNWAKRLDLYSDLVSKYYNGKIEELRAEILAKGESDDLKKQISELGKLRDKEIGSAKNKVKSIKGPYWPLMRFGRYLVVGESEELLALREIESPTAEQRRKLASMERSSDHYVVQTFDTVGQANKAKVNLQQSGFKVKQNMTKRDDLLTKVRKTDKSILNEIEESLVKKFGGNSDTIDEMRAVLNDIWYDLQPEHSAIAREAKRKGVAGASEDMLRAFTTVGTRDAHYLSRLKYADQLTDAVFTLREEARGDYDLGEVADVMEMHREQNAVYDTGMFDRFANMAVKTSYTYHLLGSPAYFMMNATQVPMITAPVLAGRFGEGRAAVALSKALVDTYSILSSSVVKHYKQHGMGAMWRFDLKLDAVKGEDAELIDTLIKRGKVNITIQHDLGTVVQGNTSSMSFDKFVQIASTPVHFIEIGNRVVTGLAAYRLARKSGMPIEAATEYAESVIDSTQFDYSPENTALLMKSIGGSKALARMVFQFRKFQQGVAHLWLSTGKKMFVGDNKAQAARTMVWLTGSTMVASGLRGLPIMLPLYALISAVSDDDDPEEEVLVRNVMHDAFGPKLGQAISSGFPAAALGFDLSQRIGYGNVLNPVPMRREPGPDSTGRDIVSSYLTAVAGAWLNVVSKFVDAGVSLRKGKPVDALEKASPKFASDVIKASRYAKDGLETRNGKTAIPADEFDKIDILGQAIGFTPRTVSDYYEGQGAVKDLQQKVERVRKDLIMRAAKGEDVKEDIREFGKKHPKRKITMSDVLKKKAELRRSARERTKQGITRDRGTKPYQDEARFVEDSVDE